VTALALLLVLTSAVAHASWNLLAKRAGGGTAFTWLLSLVAAVVCLPLALGMVAWERPALGATELGFVLGSAVLHLAYFVLLGQGYRAGDLSLVYPLARGTGPPIATLGAILLLGERPTALALAGAGLIALGVIVLTGDPRALVRSGAGRSVVYALLTGGTISAYTLWDKLAVGPSAIPPLVYFAGTMGLQMLLMAPWAVRHRMAVREAWCAHRGAAIGAGALASLSYVLMLTALASSPVSYVAPAREIGILIGVLFGARLLAEGDARRRLAGAAAMLLGIVALALG
jgi:drug/metabolite transporter (DMT)-like permease